MGSCKHTDWIRLWKNGERTGLDITDKPRRLLDDIEQVDNRTPSFLVLLGNHSKRVALTRLRIGNARLCSRRGNGDYHLFLSSAKDYKDKPLLIADGDIPSHHRLPTASRTSRCHEVAALEGASDVIPGNVKDKADALLHRSLVPFADVIILFTQDVGGLDAAMHHVRAWQNEGAASSSGGHARLILVVKREDQGRALLAVRESMHEENTSTSCFEDVCVLCMPDGASRATRRSERPAANWDVFRHTLFTALELSRQTRKRSGLLFSARHFVELLQQGAARAITASWEPFDYVKASRMYNKAPQTLASHLATFIKLFDSGETIKDVAIPLIASSFVLDHYPPEMHEFNPRSVFEAIYKVKCIQLMQETAAADPDIRQLLPTDFVSLVEEHMVEQFQNFRRLGTASEAHRTQLRRFSRVLEQIASEETCLCCLRRRPQTALRCKHSLCQNCVTIFHRHDDDDKRLVHIEQCVICSKDMEALSIKEELQTATVRVLSLDGGGARGITEIESLLELQERINLPYPVIRNFDVCFATSCGAGILLRLCDGWDIQSCRNYFRESARRAFEPRPLLRIFRKVPWVRQLLLGCSLLLFDSKYPSSNLDMLLQDEYGGTRSIMDYSMANEAGIKFGFTLTSLGDTSTYIATNYNGVGQVSGTADYEVLRPKVGLRNIPLWELVRSAIAAPFYFTPKYILNVGTFQDGGLTFFNNPVSIAMQETAALYPSKADPSIVASFGTGFSRPSSGASILGRLAGAFEVLTSSRIRWKQLLSHRRVGERTEFFRFDVEFQSAVPALDDVAKIEEVSAIAQNVVAKSSTVERLAKHLRAELFYFELDGEQPLRYANGAFSCVGHIYCRLRPSTAEYQVFMEQLSEAAATFSIAGRTLPISAASLTGTARGLEFRQTAHFRVSSRQDAFAIKLDEGSGGYSISGSPFTLQWLIQEQQLEATFGTIDHRKRKRQDGNCRARAKRRRRQ